MILVLLRSAFLAALLAATVPAPASAAAPAHDLFAAASMTRSQRNSATPTDWGMFRHDGKATWSLFGPRILGVTAMAYDPSALNVLLMAAGDGVLRSEDRGRSWRLTTGWRIADVRAFAFDAGDPQRVYAATQWGPILSVDGGRSWASSAAGLPVRYSRTIVADRTTSGRVLLGTESGIFVSEDSAASWRPIESPAVTILRLVQSISHPAFLLAGTEGRGAWCSRDGGRSWQAVDPATAGANLYAVAIRPDVADVLAIGGWETGVRVSKDGGVTWSARGKGLPNQRIQVLAFDPDHPGRLWAAVHEEGSYVSDDLGLTWTFAGLYGAYGHDYAFVPRRVSLTDLHSLLPVLAKPFVNSASWIWSAEGSHGAPAPENATPSHYQVRYFRRSFTVADPATATLSVAVSGDSRYLFFCNGELVGRGPAKGDINHHFYETFDLTPRLRRGANVLAALVLDMSRVAHRPALLGAPCSIMTYTGGFVLEGALVGREGTVIDDLKTDARWRVAVDKAHRVQNENTLFEGYLGYFEHRISALEPQGWRLPGFDDAAWAEAHVLFKAELLENRRDPTSPYGLIPRLIPQLEEGEPERFPDAYVKGGGEISDGWRRLLVANEPLVLAPHSVTDIVLDAGILTTAFPQLQTAGGAGSTVRLTYAEALRLPWDTPGAKLLGRRQPLANLASHFADETRGWTFDRRGEVMGWSDIWEPAGREETFEPLHWRAFRYVGLRIEVGASPLTLRRVSQRFTAYPYHVAARFTCSDPSLEQIWEAGLRTMRLCSHETFEDCPHYKQMQYAGDTMITSKLALLTTGDARLSRQALYHFDWSRLPEGLTQSRYPSRLVQVIPAWSIHWITTIKDYFACTGDLGTVRDLLPGVRAVLDWFRRHADADGLPSKLPFWNVTDWCPWWPRGVVPGADTGVTVIFSAQFIQALDEAGWLIGQAGGTVEAAALAAEAARLRPIAHRRFWSESEGLYFDRPGGPEVSQYGNAWAVVAGLPDEREKAILMRRFPDDPKLAPGSFFWWHAGFTALLRTGHYDEMPRHLGPWRESLSFGLSTFVEENSYWRSLCHAWSAHPVLEFQQRILGVTPSEPGFAAICIEPNLCGLEHAEGSVCTPHGPVEVAWRREGRTLSLKIAKPDGIPAVVRVPGGAERRFSGARFEETFNLS